LLDELGHVVAEGLRLVDDHAPELLAADLIDLGLLLDTEEPDPVSVRMHHVEHPVVVLELEAEPILAVQRLEAVIPQDGLGFGSRERDVERLSTGLRCCALE